VKAQGTLAHVFALDVLDMLIMDISRSAKNIDQK
jgi:hypothetical protein